MTTTFEDEVRAMLARRAADIPATDDDRSLPTGVRVALVEERPGRRRRAGLAVAAAVALLLGAAALLVAVGDEGATERTGPVDGSPTTTEPTPERPFHLALLPGGVDPTVGPVLPVGPVAATPEQAMAAVLEPVFGEDVHRTPPFDAEVTAAGVSASWYTPLGTVDPAVWTVAEQTMADTGGSVTARRTEGGWRAVAVTSDAIDLTGVGHDGERLTGSVVVDAPAPLRVSVETVDGELLGTTALTTHAESGGDASVLALGDLALDLGGRPVVLRVEAGDRPGQVGFDGVRVAAIAAVAVPPGADPASVPTTTTHPAEAALPVEGGDGRPPGEGVLWRMPVGPVGEERGAAARAFVHEVLGDADAEVVDEPQGAEPDTEVDVVVRLGSEVFLPVRVARDGDDWIVTQVGSGGVEVSRNGTGIEYTFGGPDAGRGGTVHTLVHPDGSWHRYAVGVLPPDLDEASGWIVTLVDDGGRVQTATGNPAPVG